MLLLDSLFFATLGIAVLMTILTAFDRDEIAWPIMGIVTWLICSVMVSNLERPYAFLLSDNTVLEHSLSYQGGAFMQYFFLGFALVFVTIFFNRVLMVYRESVKAKVGG